MLNVLFAGRPARWPEFEGPLNSACAAAGLDVHIATDISPDQVDYIVFAPTGEVQDFTPYTRAKAVLSLWAGVEKVVDNPTLHIPLTRMVDAGLERGMVEWVTGHVLRYHLGMDRHIVNPDHHWHPEVPPLASDRPISILGLGTLGQACAEALVGLGFPVTGWSRTPKNIEGITCVSGEDGLTQAMQSGEITVLLLPNTPATENTINADTLAQMPQGAFLINPGRGPLIDDAALIAALDRGHLAHATLDVFRVEPLPGDHPFWAHPKVTVTPHIAADTRPDTSASIVAENIRRNEAGEPMLYLVDRAAGY
ncbi:2-hydroxyacid dehydrogenase [Roseovarius sp. 2305UL8-3]|uniref:2-hydroxyacid dehydrogenase n=1 Tax=Roseovarius conchicola TaxID=3121636 RepID=UPI003529A9DA